MGGRRVNFSVRHVGAGGGARVLANPITKRGGIAERLLNAMDPSHPSNQPPPPVRRLADMSEEERGRMRALYDRPPGPRRPAPPRRMLPLRWSR